MRRDEIIRQAKREIAEENKRDKVVEVKNILRQIKIMEAQLAELKAQIKEI